MGYSTGYNGGLFVGVPVVFAKKKKPSTMENMLTTTSFTKDRTL